MPKPPPSPARRSSRARQLQPASAADSSASSTASTRNDRNTRSAKNATPNKSPTPLSPLSSEDPQMHNPPAQLRGAIVASAAPADAAPSRRSFRRQQEAAAAADSRRSDVGDEHDDAGERIVEDEETTRCVCELPEYPGPPVDLPPTTSAPSHRATKSTSAAAPPAPPPPGDAEGQGDEPGSLFIQCDMCQVWQHGGCVGIMAVDASPENYFCERCRPELHQVLKTLSGQNYSRYIPVVGKPQKSHRKSSISKDWDARTVREAERALRNAAEPAKRRSTMNSRANYEEDELLLKQVLEDSKTALNANPSEAGTSRRGKRAREGSEEYASRMVLSQADDSRARSDVKRQRTNSSEPPTSLSIGESPDGLSEHLDDGRKRQTPRGAAARSQRERELRERERERSEAANKRKGRAERRRGEEPPIAEESPKPEDMAAEDVVSATASMKDGSTNGTSKRMRLNGKRARTARSAAWNHDTASTTSGKNGKEKSASPKETIEGVDSGADSSRRVPAGPEAETAADTDAAGGAAGAPTTNGDGGGRHSNGRRGRAGTTNGVGAGHINNHNGSGNGGGGGGGGGSSGPSGVREPSWTELKKKAGLMLEYISQAQVDMARAERKGLVKAEEPPAAAIASSRRSRLGPNGGTSAPSAVAQAEVVAAGMANELATRLVKWQRDFTVEQHPAAAMLVEAESR